MRPAGAPCRACLNATLPDAIHGRLQLARRGPSKTDRHPARTAFDLWSTVAGPARIADAARQVELNTIRPVEASGNSPSGRARRMNTSRPASICPGTRRSRLPLYVSPQCQRSNRPSQPAPAAAQVTTRSLNARRDVISTSTSATRSRQQGDRSDIAIDRDCRLVLD